MAQNRFLALLWLLVWGKTEDKIFTVSNTELLIENTNSPFHYKKSNARHNENIVEMLLHNRELILKLKLLMTQCYGHAALEDNAKCHIVTDADPSSRVGWDSYLVNCGQTAGRIEMPGDNGVGLTESTFPAALRQTQTFLSISSHLRHCIKKCDHWICWRHRALDFFYATLSLFQTRAIRRAHFAKLIFLAYC